MVFVIHDDAVPLRVDEAGAVRVGKTRVLYALVMSAYLRGLNPEGIVEMYDSLSLADVYEVIGYYHRHKADVQELIADYERGAEEVLGELEADLPKWADLRARLLARRAEVEAGATYPSVECQRTRLSNTSMDSNTLALASSRVASIS